jgi:CubicO group peptidase (beta-lactamase class C family)
MHRLLTMVLALHSMGCTVNEHDIALVEQESLGIGAPPVLVRTTKSIVDEAVGDPISRHGQRRYVGLSVLVIRDGTRHQFNYGQAVYHREGGVPVTNTTLFAIGSVTKTFTATLLALLDRNGTVDVDDPLASWTSSDLGDQADITLLDLALHHSGLPKNPPGGTDIYETGAYNGDVEALMDAIEGCGSCDGPIWYQSPDAKYSNWGYSVLAFALAGAVSQSVPSAFRTHLWTPLAMSDTNYKWDLYSTNCVQPGTTCGYTDYGNCTYTAACNFSFNPRAAIGYGDAGANAIPLRGGPASEYGTGSNDYIKAGSGTLWSTPNDMMKWLAYHMLDDTPATGHLRDIVPSLSVERTHSNMAMIGKYYRTEGENHWYIKKGGLIPDQFKTFFGFSDDRRVGIVIMSNYSPYNTSLLGEQLLDAFLD